MYACTHFRGAGGLDPAADVKETIGGNLLTGKSYDSRVPDRCEMPFEVAAWDRVSVPPCHLSSRRYMVPTRYIFLESLTITQKTFLHRKQI